MGSLEIAGAEPFDGHVRGSVLGHGRAHAIGGQVSRLSLQMTVSWTRGKTPRCSLENARMAVLSPIETVSMLQ